MAWKIDTKNITMIERVEYLPKIELHLHLDCSLSPKVVNALEGPIAMEEYLRRFVAPKDAVGLPDYLERALEGITLMQEPEQIRLVTLDLFDQLQADGIIYAEIRFAPLEHTHKGLDPRQVVDIVAAAMREGQVSSGITARLILCTLRHYSPQQSMQVARLTKETLGDMVVGFDLAADEAAYPLDAHIPAFDYAHKHGIPCTAHAGEARGADSVWETIKYLNPSRIGHGVRSIEDPHLVQTLCERRIHLEVCPTSNISTRVFPSLAQHSIQALFQAGVSLGINTDGRAISYVNLNEEYQKLHKTFGWDKSHFLRCNLDALEAAFLGQEEKAVLRRRILEGYQATKTFT